MEKDKNPNPPTKEDKKKALMHLENFVREDDSAKYVIDSKNAMICRKDENADKVSCVKLKELDEKEIFSQMQELGFYCALAQDPYKIGIECRKVFY